MFGKTIPGLRVLPSNRLGSALNKTRRSTKRLKFIKPQYQKYSLLSHLYY
jgi:hypothetical protein